MPIARPEAHLLGDCVQHDEVTHTELTLTDIEADTGKGPAPDIEGGVFHASTDDFIAAMQSRPSKEAVW